MTKADIRREARRRLAANLPEREERSHRLVSWLAATAEYRAAKCVALFAPLNAEPLIESLWDVAPRQFCYPRVEGDEIHLLRVESRDEVCEITWHPKVREPAFSPGRAASLDAVDLLLVPGLAFTRDGHRLGRGGGFYDRLLARRGPRTRAIGVCFEAQIFDHLPLEPHDQPVDAVITES